MLNRFRVLKLSTRFLCAAISCFRINSMLYILTSIHSNPPSPLIIISSSTIHTSNQPILRLQDLHYAFDCIENIDEASSLFYYMLHMKPTPSIYHYHKLFNVVTKMQHYERVIIMFKELSLLDCPVDDYIMSTVIKCYSQLKEVELCFAITATFLKRGYAPNVVCYTCMIKGFFLKGNVREAVSLFKSLIKNKLCVVNEITIAIVLDGLSKSGKIGDAVDLLLMSERNDWKLDVVCYNTVMDGLCKGRMLRDGMELLFRMIERDILPNVVTYTIFLHGLCNHKKLDMACSVFNDLHSKGICPNVITYTVMIQGICKVGLFQDAKEMLEQMERVGCFANSVTYNVITQACLHHRDSFDSINLLKQIVGRDFQLDARSFFTLLRQIRVLCQMKEVYDDGVVNQLIQKLVSSDYTDEYRISSFIHKLSASDGRCSIS